jgi:hypothetical protein
MKVAIVDDGINEKTLVSYNSNIINFISQNGKISPAEQIYAPTHGGLCAEVFWETTGRLPDVSICLPKDNTHRCNVNDL